MAAGKIRVGISGRRYKGWRGKFYPEKLRQKDELPFVAETLPRFIRSQRAEGFRSWREETPDVFVFSSKTCPRFVTHLRRLRELQVPLANFFASGVLELGEKFASFLWQLPPNFKFDAERLATFFHCCREMQNLLLRKHSVALVWPDTVEWSRWMDVLRILCITSYMVRKRCTRAVTITMPSNSGRCLCLFRQRRAPGMHWP